MLVNRIQNRKEATRMEYIRPVITEVTLDVKGAVRENSADGPSRCSNSCCFYRDGASW